MIGVLAYGSLISDPGEELAAITIGRREGVTTPFCVEFARTSQQRHGAPTLVPVSNGGKAVRAVIFEVSADEQTAADIVYRREINAVGSEKTYVERPDSWTNAVRLDRIEGFEGFAVVLSTRMPVNIIGPTAEMLADLAIASAVKLDDGRDGISYLMRTEAAGIETLLSPAYVQAILDRTGAKSLDHALQVVRDSHPL